MTQPDAREALVAYERARYSSQLSFVEGWLGPLRAAHVLPDAKAFRTAWARREASDHAAGAQLRADLERDALRLATAAAGAGRSAVPPAGASVPTTAEFAVEQALHIAGAARKFTRQAAAADTEATLCSALERAQRWSQRLRWELLDTCCAGAEWTTAWDGGVAIRALQLRARGAGLEELRAVAQREAVALEALSKHLRAGRATPGTAPTARR